MTKKSCQGSVLVLVLVFISVSTAVVALIQMLTVQRVDTFSIRDVQSELRISFSEAAFAATKVLSEDPDLRIDSLAEEWAQPFSVTNQFGQVVLVQIRDAQRKLDLNGWALPDGKKRFEGTEFTLQALARFDQAPERQWIRAWRDWLDSDDEGFFEFQLRESAPPESGNVNTPVVDVRSLQDVLRPLPEEVGRPSASVLRNITALPLRTTKGNRININTAPAELLLAIAGEGYQAGVEQLVEQRLLSPIASVDPVARSLDERTARRVKALLGVSSSFYDVELICTASNGELYLCNALLYRESIGLVRVERMGDFLRLRGAPSN